MIKHRVNRFIRMRPKSARENFARIYFIQILEIFGYVFGFACLSTGYYLSVDTKYMGIVINIVGI